MIEVYGIKNCDSVKKALSFFKKHEIDFILHDFKTSPVGCNEVEKWLQKVDIATLFNARSTTYRNLKLKEKNLNNDEKKEWLCKENLLIKRPVVIFNDEIIVGFKEEIYQRKFL
jgi:Spx/MgsR family transcriptional regulator